MKINFYFLIYKSQFKFYIMKKVNKIKFLYVFKIGTNILYNCKFIII